MSCYKKNNNPVYKKDVNDDDKSLFSYYLRQAILISFFLSY